MPARSTGLSERVLTRLARAEVCELNPHFRDDYRIAWITVRNAERGALLPHVIATYAVLGLHPKKVWPRIVAQRKANLGAEYFAWCDASGNYLPALPGSLPPKKPVQMEFSFSARHVWRLEVA